MTGQDFITWLTTQKNCDTKPIEGRNITGFSIRIICKTTGRFYYFSGPFGHTEVPQYIIEEICDELWLGCYPP